MSGIKYSDIHNGASSLKGGLEYGLINWVMVELSHLATRHALRVYVGGLPPLARSKFYIYLH
ncbi:hypothetical protein M8C21_001049 [Ambrosia artemisiifolia]|uniref:Uncharacterized protein n=1 Tax=Ambrosia artemisiifolia TaxID=4212 RepID=A0AAD5G5R6_AMBAR|nr:hypothetical protein M8C21_001049 [Ambrosia artemisiifolia]